MVDEVQVTHGRHLLEEQYNLLFMVGGNRGGSTRAVTAPLKWYFLVYFIGFVSFLYRLRTTWMYTFEDDLRRKRPLIEW